MVTKENVVKTEDRQNVKSLATRLMSWKVSGIDLTYIVNVVQNQTIATVYPEILAGD